MLNFALCIFLVISPLLVFTSGCAVLPILGAVATTTAGYYKYTGDKKKARAINQFRDEVRGDLTRIKKGLNDRR